LEEQRTVPYLDQKVIGANFERFLSRLAQDGPFTGFEKALDRLLDFVHLGMLGRRLRQ